MKAYQKQEEEFTKRVQKVSIKDITQGSNIIRRHTLYKLKYEDDGMLLLKVRISPHANEDSQKLELRTEYNMCQPAGIRIMLTFGTDERMGSIES